MPLPAVPELNFHFDGVAIRVVEIAGDPWFVGKDVAATLGYANAAAAITQHCKGVAKHYPLPTAGGTQDVRVVSEPDVMRLIVNSRLPAARRFERWVFEDVLPSIRKSGRYGTPDALAVLNDPVAMRGLLLTYADKVLALEAQAKADKPTLLAFEELANTDGTLCLRDTAKVLNVRERALIQYLSAHGWIYRRPGGRAWLGYSERQAQGFLTHKVYREAAADANGDAVLHEQVRITAKGLTALGKRFKSDTAADVPTRHVTSVAARTAVAAINAVFDGQETRP